MAITAGSLRDQYAKNAEGLREMLVKAEAVAPKKYRGYHAWQLREQVRVFERLSMASDAAIIAHLENVRAAILADMAARTAEASNG